MSTLLKLAERMDKLVEREAAAANQQAIRVGKAILRDLVQITPVDTSKAESNWQVGLGSPVTGHIPAYNLGSRGSTAASSANAAIAAGEAILDAKKPGQTLYISNATPYIEELDQGSSAQFAGNFRARARLIARKMLEGGA